MQGLMTYLVPLSIAAVTIVLGLGLYNMLRGGNPNTSQMLMRWRVGLQALAVLVMMIAIYFKMR